MILYPCMFCVALLMDLFVLCVAYLTVFVKCLVKQLAICSGVFAILLLNVMDLLSVVAGALLDRPCYVVSNECDEPTSCLVQSICAHCFEVMYFGCFRGELGFLNCDGICMCVVNKQFELLKFVFDSVYVYLQYDEITLTFTAWSVCLCSVCSPWSVCEVVVIPYVVNTIGEKLGLRLRDMEG